VDASELACSHMEVELPLSGKDVPSLVETNVVVIRFLMGNLVGEEIYCHGSVAIRGVL